MKVVLVICVALLIGSSVEKHLRLAQPVPLEVRDFLEGLLEGLEVGGEEVQECIQCIEDATNAPDFMIIINDIQRAMKDFSHIDFAHMADIIDGISAIIEAGKMLMKDIEVAIADCKTALPEIQKVIQEIANIDIKRMALNLAMDLISGKLIANIKGAVEAFKIKDFETAGKDIGILLYDCIKTDVPEEIYPMYSIEDPMNDTYLIVKGLLEGLQIKGWNDTDIEKCIENAPALIAEIEKIITEIEDVFAHFKITELIPLFTDLFVLVTDLIADVKNCSSPAVRAEIEAILAKIKNETFVGWAKAIVQDLIFHGGEMIADLIGAFSAFKNKEFEKFGNDLGQLLYILIFPDEKNKTVDIFPSLRPKDIVNERDIYPKLGGALKNDTPPTPPDNIPEDIWYFLEGLLTGIGLDGQNVTDLVKCVSGVDDIIPNFEKLIAEFKVIDWTSFPDLLKVGSELFTIIWDVVQDIKPCGMSDSWNEIKVIVAEFEQLTLAKWMEHLMGDLIHGATIVSKIVDLVTQIEDKNFSKMGSDIGFLIWIFTFGELN